MNHDPVALVAELLRDPDTGRPFVLYDAQVDFLRRAFTLTSDGRLPYPELVFSAPKKSGKTTLAAIAALVVKILTGRNAAVHCVANDFEQAASRVFKQVARIVEASPVLAREAKVFATRINFADGSIIQADAADYAGGAGGWPSLAIFDELWAYSSEAAHRLWDEMVPIPTRKISARMTVTYAGFVGESALLEKLYQRGLIGKESAADLYEQAGMLMYWTHRPPAPWQTPEWLDQMRQQLRPSAYSRMIENQFVGNTAEFIATADWDRCVVPDARPVLAHPQLRVHVGVDASVKRDHTAIVAVTYDRASRRVALVHHRIFKPTPADPIDFDGTVVATLRDLRRRFAVASVQYDPYQLVSVAQRLAAEGIPMREFSQTVPNLTEASTNLFDLIKHQNLIAYPDEDLRRAVSQAVAVETSRGWRIAKEKASHKIDVLVALAMAALAATKAPDCRVVKLLWA
jgi:phage terminase large subunit-like protein